MIRGHQAGCGAVVTKTIRLNKAVNPVFHIGKINSGDTLINCEKWADTDRALWYEREIPMAKKAGCVVIASVGHTPAEAEAIAADAEEAGADMLELVSYTENDLLPMLDLAKKRVEIPVICKLSGNWPDAAGTATKCLEHGADGICAIDSLGPALKIDIYNRRPEMMGEEGYGWMSGAAMRPISMRINSEIARKHPDFVNLYGSGGCITAEDAIEFLMAGCRCVGVCSVGILHGINHIEKMCYELSAKLKALGFSNAEEPVGAANANFPPCEQISKMIFKYDPYMPPGPGDPAGPLKRKCVNCGRCATVCCYDARKLDFPYMEVDGDKCRYCGLCVSVCPTKSLTANFDLNLS